DLPASNLDLAERVREVADGGPRRALRLLHDARDGSTVRRSRSAPDFEQQETAEARREGAHGIEDERLELVVHEALTHRGQKGGLVLDQRARPCRALRSYGSAVDA